MQEMISVSVGQAGVQVASAAWELFCIEHGVRADGCLISPDRLDDDCSNVLFVPLNDRVVPRSLKIDFEPTVLDEIKVGVYRNLFNPNFMISGFEDSGGNFARGCYTEGRKYIKITLSALRKLMEQCSCLQGLCILNSFDGGTGAGFTSLLEEQMSIMSAKTCKIQIGIYPSNKLASSTVYPYNALLHTNFTISQTDMCPMLDNESLYEMCSNKLLIEQPTFTNINRIIAQIYSNITVSLRYENSISNCLNQLCINLVPYPRIHFALSHISPMCTNATYDKSSYEVTEITDEVFLAESQLARCDTRDGKFMCCVLQYRGDVMPSEVNKAIYSIKQNASIKFVDWCPTGFKVGVSTRPSASPPGSCIAEMRRNVTMLSNTSSIVEMWEHVLRAFDCLYYKKAFVHWFVGEGLELNEFEEAKNTTLQIITDYRECSPKVDTEKANNNASNQWASMDNLKVFNENVSEDNESSNSFQLCY